MLADGVAGQMQVVDVIGILFDLVSSLVQL